MIIKEKIIRKYSENIEFLKKIEALMKKIGFEGADKRDMLLVGFSRNLLSHFISISFLMEKELYNSAFALERVFFENAVKLRYMYYIMKDSEIEILYDAESWDKKFPYMSDMTIAIDDFIGIDFYKDIKDRTFKAMCDYTHTGALQIARNFNDIDSVVEACFSDELILDTLESNTQFLKTSIMVLMESIGLKKGFLTEQDMKNFLNY